MAWDDDQLKRALTTCLDSGLVAQIEETFSSGAREVKVSVSSLALACGSEIDEEEKLLQLLKGLSDDRQWVHAVNFAFLPGGVVEFRTQTPQ